MSSRGRVCGERWVVCRRFIVTPTVSQAPYLRLAAAPRSYLTTSFMVIAREDDTSFGMLHSRLPQAVVRCMSALGTASAIDPRYTPTTTFETFPFPEGLTPNLPAASYAADPRAQAIAAAARELVEKRELWLNPPDLVEHVPEVVPGFPDRIVPRNARAAAVLKSPHADQSVQYSRHAGGRMARQPAPRARRSGGSRLWLVRRPGG